VVSVENFVCGFCVGCLCSGGECVGGGCGWGFGEFLWCRLGLLFGGFLCCFVCFLMVFFGGFLWGWVFWGRGCVLVGGFGVLVWVCLCGGGYVGVGGGVVFLVVEVWVFVFVFWGEGGVEGGVFGGWSGGGCLVFFWWGFCLGLFW